MANTRAGAQRNSAAAKTTHCTLVLQVMRTPHSNHGVTTLLLDPEGYQSERLVTPTSRGASPLRLTRFSGNSSNAHKRNDGASANRSRRPARLHSFTIRAVPETKPHDITAVQISGLTAGRGGACR